MRAAGQWIALGRHDTHVLTIRVWHYMVVVGGCLGSYILGHASDCPGLNHCHLVLCVLCGWVGAGDLVLLTSGLSCFC